MVLTLLALQAQGPEFKIPWYQKKKSWKTTTTKGLSSLRSACCPLSTHGFKLAIILEYRRAWPLCGSCENLTAANVQISMLTPKESLMLREDRPSAATPPERRDWKLGL